VIKFSKFQISAKPTDISNERAKIIIEPLIQGFGITIGNALRRTMLSAMPGTATFAVKINNITHEYQPLDGVKEDVMQIILNIKKLVISINEDVLNEDDINEIKIEN
jgi:DNA-directed RNA polymerase subunit alpha